MDIYHSFPIPSLYKYPTKFGSSAFIRKPQVGKTLPFRWGKLPIGLAKKPEYSLERLLAGCETLHY
jgi:hypothetical protein